MAAEESWIALSIFVPVSDLFSVCSVLQMSEVLKHSLQKKRYTKKYTKFKPYCKSKICQFALFCRLDFRRSLVSPFPEQRLVIEPSCFAEVVERAEKYKASRGPFSSAT